MCDLPKAAELLSGCPRTRTWTAESRAQALSHCSASAVAAVDSGPVSRGDFVVSFVPSDSIFGNIYISLAEWNLRGCILPEGPKVYL